MSPDLRTALGRRGELLARQHYERLGFALVAANHRTRYGEIDLILFDGQVLVFCEVKTRRSGPGHPFDALGPLKQSQVRRMARAWLAETPDRPYARDVRCDAVAVTVDARGGLVALEQVEGAF